MDLDPLGARPSAAWRRCSAPARPPSTEGSAATNGVRCGERLAVSAAIGCRRGRLFGQRLLVVAAAHPGQFGLGDEHARGRRSGHRARRPAHRADRRPCPACSPTSTPGEFAVLPDFVAVAHRIVGSANTWTWTSTTVGSLKVRHALTVRGGPRPGRTANSPGNYTEVIVPEIRPAETFGHGPGVVTRGWRSDG